MTACGVHFFGAMAWHSDMFERNERPEAMTESLDDRMIDTPDGPMTWAAWKKKNPVQVPSRRTKGKELPNKVKRFTGEK